MTCLPTVLILAGGLGTRLQAVVRDRPKPMALIEGRPFIHYLLEYLERQGVRRVVLATGYLASKVEEGLGKRFGLMELVYSPEFQPLGTAGAIAQALPTLGEAPFLVLNGDSFAPIDLADFIHQAHRLQTPATLAVCYAEDASRFGTIEFNEQGLVTAFREKSDTGRGWVNAGIYYFHPSIFTNIRTDIATSLEKEVFSHLIPNLGVYCLGSKLLDIGTPESYLQAANWLERSLSGLAFLKGLMPGIKTRIGVGVLLFNQKGEVLLERRSDCQMWGLLGGRVEPGESILDSAHREILEETGLRMEILGVFGVYSDPSTNLLGYQNNGDIRHLVDIVLEANILGGTLKTSSESELIQFFPVNQLPPESEIIPPARNSLRDLCLKGRQTQHIN